MELDSRHLEVARKATEYVTSLIARTGLKALDIVMPGTPPEIKRLSEYPDIGIGERPVATEGELDG